jgi:hypothetical protein
MYLMERKLFMDGKYTLLLLELWTLEFLVVICPK